MPVARVRTVLTGLVEGGGLSTHMFDILDPEFVADDLITAVGDFWEECKVHISNGVTMNIDPQVDILRTDTGELTGVKNGSPISKSGTASGNVMPPSNQRLIRLRTDTILLGKRIQGKLYIPGAVIPLSDTQEVPEAVQGTFIGAALGLALTGPVSANYCVWSRKNGFAAKVTGATVWDKYAVLRSRRD